MKQIFILFLIVLCSTVLTMSLVFAENTEENMRTVTDLAGLMLELPDNATYATLGGPLTQLPYVFGAGDSIVAISAGAENPIMDKLDPKNREKPVVRNGMTNINIEELLQAAPSAVIAYLPDGQLVSRKTNIPVFYFTGSMSDSFDDFRRQMLFMGDFFNNPEAGVRYNRYFDDMLVMIDERVSDIPHEERAIVFIGEGQNHLASLGGDTFVSALIEAGGALNAVKEISSASGKEEGLHSGFTEITMEDVIGANPDILIIDTGTLKDLENEDRWKSIEAVKSGNVFMRPSGVYTWSRPTAESAVLFPLYIAHIAYPERFQDINIVEEFRAFYQEIFNLELTDEEITNIISGHYTGENSSSDHG
jgi:iron complex transport system substrate-binding protein